MREDPCTWAAEFGIRKGLGAVWRDGSRRAERIFFRPLCPLWILSILFILSVPSSVDLHAGGEGLEDGADDGAVGVGPVCGVVVEAFGGVLVDGADGELDGVRRGSVAGGGEGDEGVVGEREGADGEPDDVAGEKFGIG